MTEEEISLSETSQVKLDIKTLIGIIIGIISVAGIWFDLTGKIADIEGELVRLKYNQALNDEFRIKWPRGEMGALPADGEQFMLIEDLYKSVEKIEKNLEQNMTNKVNIERLQKDVEKMLDDVEKLKDADREIKNGH